ncbi:hypothetical protein CNMCM7691_002159 [Aspergillus felis]|uniref:Uncharacterized protein n=1 Tax=Aspergillus felis TaxID=1287682 RepID=A0A8H6R0V5_9EURO|nr:hypothetical protein CNMCM7691_002159 [Aspergillus felis]
MAMSDPYYIFRTFSGLGVFTLWILMMLNGTFAEMISTNLRGVFPTGTALQKSWTGIRAVDFFLSLLIVFFNSVVSIDDLPDVGPFLISVDLVLAIGVFNMMTVVEGRRNRKTSPLRSPAWWQTMWNFFGAACALPVYLHLYVEKRLRTPLPRIPPAQAQALPFSAIWNTLISVPLLVPTVFRASPFQIQAGMVLWLLGPPSLSLFQDAVSSLITATGYRGVQSPTTFTYWIVGGISAICHVAVVLSPYFFPGVTLSRIYWPNHSAVQPGPYYLAEGAMLFIQYDYIIINLCVLAVGFYKFNFGSAAAAKLSIQAQPAVDPRLVFTAVTAVLGPGAGMAWLLCDKERELEKQNDAIKK